MLLSLADTQWAVMPIVNTILSDRCMDLDGDGYLSMYELEYFYEEQLQRMEALGIETLPFHDCLCQVSLVYIIRHHKYFGQVKRQSLTWVQREIDRC